MPALARPRPPRRWVLMRGLSRGRGHWGEFVDRFRQAYPDDQIETADLPGCGELRRLSAPLTVADTMAAVRETVGGVRPQGVWLLGLSLGGMVAYEWAHRYPEEVTGAVLINTSMGGLSPPWRRLRLSAAARILTAFLTRDPVARERRLFELTSCHSDLAEIAELADTTVARWVALARTEPVRRLNVLRQLVAAARYRVQTPAPTLPFLLLVGRRDRMVHPSCAAAIARAACGATLREHPAAGHDLPLDDPEWVLGELAQWLPERNRTQLLQI